MEDKIKELQEEIKELRDKETEVENLEEEVIDLENRICELENGPEPVSFSTLEDQMKYEYFLEHFNTITLSELESLIKLKA